MVRTRSIPITLILLLAVVLIAGCSGPGPGPVPSITPTPITSSPILTETPAAPPEVFIVKPAFDAGIPAGDVTVVVEVHNFRPVSPDRRNNHLGEGHFIYYRDVVPPVAPGRPAFSAPGTYVSTPDTSYTWHNITVGTHTFAVQLVNNDNTPLNPPVVTDNDVTVYSPSNLSSYP